MKKLTWLLLLYAFTSQVASAGVCDMRPSKLVGGALAGSVAAGTGATAATGIGLKAAGVYAITNGVTGATMLGSTAAGASAAGTVGIIGGTSGVIGTVGAVLVSPLVIVPAAIVAGAVGVFEGGCYVATRKK